MRAHRLYVPATLRDGAELSLDGERSHYVARVLRARPGDPLVLFDGGGGEHAGTVVAVSKQAVTVSVGTFREGVAESPLHVHLLQGISRGDRMDWVVQKATELGVARITPVLTSRSVVRLDGERARRRAEHWLAIARGACEQCGRNVVPRIDAPLALEDALRESADGARVVLDPEAEAPLADVAAGRSVTLLIGPEGGFSPEESGAARAAGFAGARLGPRTLRTETAAIVAVVLLQARLGDLG